MARLDIKEAMERWARWRYYKAWHELGYGECVSGKLLDGIKRIQCPAAGCVKGSTYLTLNGQRFYLPCSQCMGSGYISAKSTATKINPKLIRGTGGRYPDELSVRVDWLVCQLPRLQKRAIMQEYCWSGTPAIKAQRIYLTEIRYNETLETAHNFIRQNLEEYVAPQKKIKAVKSDRKEHY